MRRHHRGRHLGICLAAGGLLACGDPGEKNDSIRSARLAFSVCDETVPADLFVDGIPAYDQCAASMDAAIYSNNGVDTSTTALDDTWVRTQWSGGYQCTELAHRYLYFRWGIEWLPRGNAGTWCDDAPDADSGVEQTFTPVHGDVIVFPPGECGADGYYGHVALVDTVDPGGARVTIVEQNRAGRRSVQTSCAGCFLHVLANTGVAGTGGASGAGGAATGGTEPDTGGAPPETGGTPPDTGGTPPVTGGTLPATGGAQGDTGGAGPGTGGGIATGGSAPAPTGGGGTGGSVPATGGFAPLGGASGGLSWTGGVTATDGAAPVTGGAAPATGGALTGGAASTGSGATAPASTGGALAEAAAYPAEADDDAGCACSAVGRPAPARGAPLRIALLGALLAGVLGLRRGARDGEARAWLRL